MLANYGYNDASGDFFITIDTDKCSGCGECIKVCPAKVLEMITDESDPFRDIPVVAVTDEQRKKIKYSCAPCKPAGSPAERDKGAEHKSVSDLPCVKSCAPGAIAHSW